MAWFENYVSVPETLRGERIPLSMFPPDAASPEAMALRHCMRLFPSDQNTGGFFVTLLRKTRDLPGGERQTGLPSFEDAARSAKRARKAQAQAADATGALLPKTRRWPMSEKAKRRVEAAAQRAKEQEALGDHVDVHQYAKLRADHWDHIHAFYGIKDDFPHVRLSNHRSPRAHADTHTLALSPDRTISLRARTARSPCVS